MFSLILVQDCHDHEQVREFLKMSGKFFDVVKVSKKSRSLFVKCLVHKSSQKRKEVENEEENSQWPAKKAKHGFCLINK